MNAALAHLNEPRVGMFQGRVILTGGNDYRKELAPDKARELATELINNANRIDRKKDTP